MKIYSSLILFFLFSISLNAQNPVTTISGDIHKGVVKEVLQTSEYTYLNVKEDTSVTWLAVPLMDAKVGDTCYHISGIEMIDFKSRELNRVFPRVYFLDFVGKTPEGALKKEKKAHPQVAKPKSEKAKIFIEPGVGTLSLAEVFNNRESISGKTIKIKGGVVKYNEQIMGKNWAHLQDGSSFGDDFDLTVTTKEQLKVGDIVTLEGKITLNKDFGSGYFFKIIMEEAVIVK
ncbi:MAG: hypothetical protein WCO63_04450 [Bacteroidota bacterium]